LSRPTDDPDGTAPDAQRLREVFGEVLPETTSDERDDAEPSDAAAREEWLLRNRPPHH
jgi:hypothetical protein